MKILAAFQGRLINTPYAGIEALGNITDADLILIAKCEVVAEEGFRIHGFGSGQAISVDAADTAFGIKGVDGRSVFGYKSVLRTVTITLLPTSPSIEIIRCCIAVQRSLSRTLRWDMQLRYPSLKTNYSMENGVLVSARDVPEAKNVLDDVTLVFQFDQIKVM